MDKHYRGQSVYTSVLTGNPGLLATISFQLRVAGTPVGDAITTGIVHEGSGVYSAQPLIPDDAPFGVAAWWWDRGDGDDPGPDDPFLIVEHQATAPFCSPADVMHRLGRESFTDAESAQVDILIDLTTGEILAALGKDDEWANTLDAPPTVLRSVCIEVVCRVMVNPQSLRSSQEQLGQYGHSETYINAGAVELTDAEVLRVRRAAFGSNSGSARARSIADEIAENPDDLYPGGPA